MSPILRPDISLIIPTISNKATETAKRVPPILTMALPLHICTTAINPATMPRSPIKTLPILPPSIDAILVMAIANKRSAPPTATIDNIAFGLTETLLIAPILLTANANTTITIPKTVNAPIAPHSFPESNSANLYTAKARIPIAIAIFRIALALWFHAAALKNFLTPVPIRSNMSPSPSKTDEKLTRAFDIFKAADTSPTRTPPAKILPRPMPSTTSIHFKPTPLIVSQTADAPLLTPLTKPWMIFSPILKNSTEGE